ncbi:hypothetical protein [Nonomuraea lactucae]|uniref:hypothetical protein n=1 Tax=Nonomuraea lactucae TaxID=2249762 RepID=UPI000DE48BFF|nr:hypothetical protein [Nonomuraea lactucae]
MGFLVALIVAGAVFWWLYWCVVNPWRTHRHPRRTRHAGPAVTGAHDAGVWVNPVVWARIIADLEGEPGTWDR